MKNQHQVMWLVALIIGMLSWPQTSLSSEIFKDRFRAPVYLDEIWGQEGRKTWTGEEMEEITDYCYETSIRWGAISNFDINLDDKSDLLLAISCYQPPNPSPNEKHNQQVIGAWRLFCSQADGSHDDCTEKVFGTKEIRATAPNDTGGGNPYIHVLHEPKDLNGDGYP